jgi:hypothetical protein
MQRGLAGSRGGWRKEMILGVMGMHLRRFAKGEPVLGGFKENFDLLVIGTPL